MLLQEESEALWLPTTSLPAGMFYLICKRASGYSEQIIMFHDRIQIEDNF